MKEWATIGQGRLTMKVILLVLLLSLFSCQEDPCQKIDKNSDDQTVSANAANCPLPETEPDEPEGPADSEDNPIPLPTPDEDPEQEGDHDGHTHGDIKPPQNFSARVTFFNFDKTSEGKVLKALEIIKNVVMSKEFKERVLNYTYEGKKEFVDNNGLSNEEILKKIYQGAEDLLPEADSEMDLELQLYYKRFSSTVGYTYPDTLRIWMNTKFFNSYTPIDVAGNIFHEWTHKLGFGHDFYYSPSRDHSVPYAVGRIIEELGEKYK